MNIKNLTRRSFNTLAAASVPYFQSNISESGEITKIKTREVPSTGEQIPIIGLGTSSSFMVDPSDRNGIKQRKEVIKTLLKYGGNFIDTAPMYRGSEKLVGNICYELDITNKAFLATKVLQSDELKGELELRNSFKFLKKKTIDLIQVHNLVDIERKLKVLSEWKKNGKYRYIGVTHWRPNIQEALIPIIKSEQVDFVQFQYNIEEREAEKRLLPLAQEHGIATIINVPFGRGKLFRYTKGEPLPEWATSFAATWGEFYLKYILSHQAVTCVIPATSKPYHMQENALAGMSRLPDPKENKKMIAYMKDI